MKQGGTIGRKRIPKIWFDTYLRTGATPWEQPDAVELKSNPWHDPTNGQFTFRGQGNWAGGGFTGGSGGSGGGGGASGSWGAGAGAAAAAAKTGKSPAGKQPGALPAVQAAAAVSVASAPQSHVVVRNGYSYTLDPSDRTTSETGTLTLASDPQRSRSVQATAGGSDRLTTDDGGHYIAARFNGPTDTFNHFAQDANLNRGSCRVLEDKWAKDIKTCKQVYVSIKPVYDGSSKRPSKITVLYSVDGQLGFRPFSNKPKGKPHGK